MKKNGNPPKEKRTRGQRYSDWIATFVGSWEFIIGLGFLMLIWIVINVLWLFSTWDPYPFILLNFVLSTLAAVQAPIILMSQNRQAQRDRITAKYDYQINRKAEREIAGMQRDLTKISRQIKDLRLLVKNSQVKKK